MRSLKNKILLIFIAIITLSTCKPTKSGKQLESYFEKIQPLSKIIIPVELHLESVQRKINEQEVLNQTIQIQEEAFNIKIWKRELIRISGVGEYLFSTVPLRIKINADGDFMGIDLSTLKDTEFDIDLKFKSHMSINEDWHINIVTEAAGFDWVKKPNIKLGPLSFSLAPLIDPSLKSEQKNLAKLLDKEIASQFQIKKIISASWLALQQPVLISEEHQAWLNFKPEALEATPFRFDKGKIKIILGIEGLTQTFISSNPNPQILKNKFLPLKTVKEMTDTTAIVIVGELPRQKLESLARQEFIGKTFYYKNGKKKVIIDKIDIYGNENLMMIKLGMIGNVKGNMILKGKPVFDPHTRSYILKDLDYDIKTKNAMARLGDLVKHDQVVSQLQSKLVLPLGEELDKAQKVISNNLNNFPFHDQVVFSATITDIMPGEVIVGKEAIKAIIKAKGTVNFNIELN